MNRKPRILICFGTRPEAIKMAPVVDALSRHGGFDARVVVTAQHRELLDQVLEFTGIKPDVDLDLMQPDQSIEGMATRILDEFGQVLDRERPDRVLLHGDTITTLMGALACFFRKIPVGHVEAGLRSGNVLAPWPEEVNRRICDMVSDLHFAPTKHAAGILAEEGISAEAIHLTGNTVVDALLSAQEKVAENPRLVPIATALKHRLSDKRLVLVTTHRRENFGAGIAAIAAAITRIAERGDSAVVLPLHPNPNVQTEMKSRLIGVENVLMIDPLSYPEFVAVMDAADIILTDSGGIQEEAPALGKPVLVLRDVTERPEGVEAGTAKLVGTCAERIVEEVSRLLDDAQSYDRMSAAHNPYGDGRSAEKIVAVLAEVHGARHA